MTTDERTAVIVVDHGSRRSASNEMLQQAVAAFAAHSSWEIVEPAHMELAEPSIATAFRRCAAQGARRIIVFPYFLSPGRHWSQDIPELVQQAAAEFPAIPWLVTAPFGLHPGMLAVMQDRIEHCLQQADERSTHASSALKSVPMHDAQTCDVCRATAPCRWHAARSLPK